MGVAGSRWPVGNRAAAWMGPRGLSPMRGQAWRCRTRARPGPPMVAFVNAGCGDAVAGWAAGAKPRWSDLPHPAGIVGRAYGSPLGKSAWSAGSGVRPPERSGCCCLELLTSSGGCVRPRMLWRSWTSRRL